jgi:glycogen debranching enzyme
MSWIDTCLQQIISAKLLFKIGDKLERWQEIETIIDEIDHLTNYINKFMWNDQYKFYFDRYKNNQHNLTFSIGAYWSLLAEIVPLSQLTSFINHLRNPQMFNRPHLIPSLVANHPKYQKKGRYWVGGVWSPTNYMVLKGLDQVKEYQLAHQISLNHLLNVVEIYQNTGTLWENYAPEIIEPASPAKPNFVGWSGLSTINIFLENVIGIKFCQDTNKLIWHINLLEEHGIKNYPLFDLGIIDLICVSRTTNAENPKVIINSNLDFDLLLIWNNKQQLFHIKPGVNMELK